MRVLLLADDCNPDWPSLPVVSYKLCRAIGDHAVAVLVTHVRNEPAIAREGAGRCEVAFINNEYIAKPMYRLAQVLRGGTSVAWTANIALYYPSYLAFEREVWRRFGADLRSGRFDLVHRITPMSPTLPSPLIKWSSVPFVLGPINGGLKWPPGYVKELSHEREWMTFVRDFYRYLPYHHATYKHASAVLAGFQHTITDLPGMCLDRIINCPEVGIDPQLFSAPAHRTLGERLTFLYVGRLVPYKCAHIAVGAFAASPVLRRHILRIVGDGPERPRLEGLIRQHGLEGCVDLVGGCSQARVGEIMRESDIFVFPSIRELGAGVVIEAMACGLACVVVDYGAPGTLVGTTRGIRIPIGSKPQMTADFARELEGLAADPARITRLGAEGRNHAMSHYTWDSKARSIVEVYRWVLGERADRPTIPL